MSANKTRATDLSVDAHLAAKATPAQRADCEALIALCQGITQHAPKMWGPSIVGFGSYSYRYDSGHAGQAPLAGFAVRGRELVVYLGCDDEAQPEWLAKLGPHRRGQSCLYFKRLADLDEQILAQLIAASVAAVQRRYPPAPQGV